MENINEKQKQELTQEEAYEPSLGKVYQKWQSKPSTVAFVLSHRAKMSKERREAMAKELRGFGMPEENKSPQEKQRSTRTTVIVISDDEDVECACDPTKTAQSKQVIVISDDESYNESDNGSCDESDDGSYNESSNESDDENENYS